ncbi:MAG: Tol-Pal system beta propeller repeat protein TolB [Desulfobacterales bacterium]|nr:Tol-Pal system beta propeller repeat protein TolB [Desulfobacterales bacterium]
MKLKSTSILKTSKTFSSLTLFGILLAVQLCLPGSGLGRIYIDINAPSIQRIKIAIPDFKNFSRNQQNPDLATALPGVIANDLDLSGYFSAMEKTAFLAEESSALSLVEIRFRDWSVIGADLLLKAGYTCIGQSLEVEFRLFDVFRGREILAKRVLGKVGDYRALMHRIANEIIYAVTGHKGMFLSKLAFVGTATGQKEIYTCDYDGHNLEQLTSDKSIALLPRWSPTGDKIFFNSYKDGEGPMLYLKDMVSSKITKVSARKGLNIGAAWAPDGKSVALTLSHGDNPDIYTIDLSGKIISRLTDHWGINVSPAFSPDGNRIAFVSNRSGSPQIYVYDLKERKEERLTFEGKYNTSPAWSSLNRIAFSGMEDGLFHIYTMDSNGGNLRKLTENQGNNEDPCWSVDGRYLVFSSNRDGAYHLYLMNANGQNQRKITAFKGEQTSPSWAP